MIVTCSAQQRGLRCWKSWQILDPPSLALPRNPAKYEVSTVSTAPPNAVHSKSLVQAKGKEKESKELVMLDSISLLLRTHVSRVTVLRFSLHMPTCLWSPSSAISGNIQCQCTLQLQVSLSVHGEQKKLQ